jgi:hypothetical protein
MSVLFDVKYFWTNLSQYSGWLVDTETPFILLAIAGLVLLWRRERIDHGGMPALAKHRLSYLFVGFAAALYGCYAVYLPFDNWTFLRFLLPAVALLLLLCSLSLLHLSARLPSFFSRFILVACFVGFLAWRWDLNDVRLLRPHERRNVVIGEYVRDHLPPNAIVFSMLQAGSIRFYSGRLTLRWDWLPDDWLDRSVTYLTAHGYSPFLLIEAEERTQFVQKFSGQSKIGSLNLTPVATYYGDADARADLYDLGNPNRVPTTAAIGPRPRRP